MGNGVLVLMNVIQDECTTSFFNAKILVHKDGDCVKVKIRIASIEVTCCFF